MKIVNGNLLITNREERAAARKIAKRDKLTTSYCNGIFTVVLDDFGKAYDVSLAVVREIVGPCPNVFE